MSADRRYGDQRDEPLDIRSTREDPSVDERKDGFQNVEGPGARPGERAIGVGLGSEEARALDDGNEDPVDLDAEAPLDAATTGSPNAPLAGSRQDRDGNA